MKYHEIPTDRACTRKVNHGNQGKPIKKPTKKTNNDDKTHVKRLPGTFYVRKPTEKHEKPTKNHENPWVTMKIHE